MIAVVDLGSIVAAARRQALTPAAVSQRLQVLEAEMRAPLLIRRANTITPTRLCLDLLPRMRSIVAECRALRQAAAPDALEGTLRVGAISTLLTGLVPDALRALRDNAPAITLQIEPGSSARLYDALLAGRLDAALIVAPPFDVPDQIALHTLKHEGLCLLLPPDHPTTDLAAVFRDLPLIEYDPTTWGGQLADRYLRDHGIRARRFCTLDGLEAISDLVARGIGAALVPRWHGVGRAHPVPGDAAYARRLVCAMPRGSDRPACDAAFLTALGLAP
nr:LysR family transcriptional regulator [Falsirhodobacter halotolerans]